MTAPSAAAADRTVFSCDSGRKRPTGPETLMAATAVRPIVRPLQDRPVRVDRETLTLGYAGDTVSTSATSSWSAGGAASSAARRT